MTTGLPTLNPMDKRKITVAIFCLLEITNYWVRLLSPTCMKGRRLNKGKDVRAVGHWELYCSGSSRESEMSLKGLAHTVVRSSKSKIFKVAWKVGNPGRN